MLGLVPESIVPESDPPPDERRHVGDVDVRRDQPADLGPPEVAPSSLESRPPSMPHYSYERDQSLGQTWRNDGTHVRVGRPRPDPDGEHEPSIYPQRPTFRTPPPSWTADLVADD